MKEKAMLGFFHVNSIMQEAKRGEGSWLVLLRFNARRKRIARELAGQDV